MSSTASSSTAVDIDGKESTKSMTRTSQRPRERVKTNDTDGGPKPRTKSTGVRQRKTGRLSRLMSMPMDILMEIFGHLHPLDLLHVARTTKAFRRVLMHRSSLFVWKAAMSNVPGFPECPPDQSEPQWATLAFDTHCTFCFRPSIRTVDWRLRVRLCLRCNERHITNWFQFNLQEGFHEDMTSAVPHRFAGSLLPEFLRRDYRKFYAQYDALEDPDAREAFVAERQKLVKGIEEHVKRCAAWANAYALARSDELDRLRSSRHQAIVDKLTALGWGDEINKIPEYEALTTHKLVKVPQLLTERIWANISGTMIEYMEEMKAKRLAREIYDSGLRP